MSDKKSNPPRFAIWWLRHACPGGDNDALTGDLIERFREGQTRRWFWRQVLIAFVVGILCEARRHWPAFCYAITGTQMPALLWRAFGRSAVLHWYGPQLVDVPAALLVLVVGLRINGTFRWVSLFRTGLINLALLTLGEYLPVAFPSITNSVAGNSHSIARVMKILIFFAFLVAAWLGCWSPRHADDFEKQAPA